MVAAVALNKLLFVIYRMPAHELRDNGMRNELTEMSPWRAMLLLLISAFLLALAGHTMAQDTGPTSVSCSDGNGISATNSQLPWFLLESPIPWTSLQSYAATCYRDIEQDNNEQRALLRKVYNLERGRFLDVNGPCSNHHHIIRLGLQDSYPQTHQIEKAVRERISNLENLNFGSIEDEIATLWSEFRYFRSLVGTCGPQR